MKKILCMLCIGVLASAVGCVNHTPTTQDSSGKAKTHQGYGKEGSGGMCSKGSQCKSGTCVLGFCK